MTPAFLHLTPAFLHQEQENKMREWKIEYVGFDESIDEDTATKRFLKRHKLAFYAVALPFAFSFISMLSLVKLGYPEIFFTLFWVFGLTIFSYVHFIYRCPRCGTRPTSSTPGTTGILLFPKKCSCCKAPLLVNHPWGQD